MPTITFNIKPAADMREGAFTSKKFVDDVLIHSLMTDITSAKETHAKNVIAIDAVRARINSVASSLAQLQQELDDLMKAQSALKERAAYDVDIIEQLAPGRYTWHENDFMNKVKHIRSAM